MNLLIGLNPDQAGQLPLYDAIQNSWHAGPWCADPRCPVSGDHPLITERVDYEGFCSGPHPTNEAPSDTAPVFEMRALPAERLMADGKVRGIDVRTHEE